MLRKGREYNMSKVIAIANQKGGVAKTTSTFNISYVLSEMGYKVLMVDLDPQASLTIACGIEPLDIEKNIFNALQRKSSDYIPIEECIIKKGNIDFLTSSIDLASLEMEMLGWTSREHCLERCLARIRDNYDYILIDCPPQLSILTINGLTASDYILIPCKTDYLSYRGLENLLDTVEEVQELLNPRLKVIGIMATLYDKRIKDDVEVYELLKQKYGDTYGILETIKLLAAAKKGVCEGISTVEKYPNSDISTAYKQVAKRITELK